LVEKIMHCDEVIHLQQLSVPWKRPSDPIFHFLSDQNAANYEQDADLRGGGSQDHSTVIPGSAMDHSEVK
jgi:hypothetical protein